ncbi:hypothetical protein [Lysinibacillus xylanilyticus]|uniref:hypothetical protein n=1 Tax=Lysinibacillus xylanilyticus TaxID=582475 RepID=UPI00380EB69D
MQRSDSKRGSSARKRSGSGNSTDVGHKGVITGRDDFSLRSSMCSPPRSRPVFIPINLST